MKISRLGFVTILPLSMLACDQRANQPGAPQSAFQRIARSDNCLTPRIHVVEAPDSIGPDIQCALINAALRELPRIRAQTGVAPADSLSIRSAGIYQWTFVDTAGGRAAPYVTIEFCVSDRPYDLVVYMEPNGVMTPSASHKRSRACGVLDSSR